MFRQIWSMNSNFSRAGNGIKETVNIKVNGIMTTALM